MKNTYESILWISFYGAMLSLSIMLGSSIEPKAIPAQIKAPVANPPMKQDTIELVLDKILKIENSANNAIGDSGRSIGCFQITKDCVKDVNKRFRTSYTHSMMFDSAKARQVAKKYIQIGNEVYLKKEGKHPTINVMLRNYNGGAYNGYRNQKTLNYIK